MGCVEKWILTVSPFSHLNKLILLHVTLGNVFASLFILSRNAWEFLIGHLLIQPFQPTNDFSDLFMTHEKYVGLCVAWGNEESPMGHPIDHVLF